MHNFQSLNLCSALQSNLAKLAFVTPTPIQAQAIPPALAGSDVVATSQTGTGKTLAFVLPLLEALSALNPRGVSAVILTPTRELAIQINETFLKLAAGTKIRSAVVVGGAGELPQLRAIRAGAQVLIATPGRLCDFLNRRLVNLSGVSHFVLDEADRMLDMGFLPALREILRTIPSSRQTLLFSATIEKSVAGLIQDYTRDAVRVAIGSTTRAADQVAQHHYEIEKDRKLDLLTHILRAEQGSVLVFARTKHGTDRLAQRLAAAGFKSARIHGDRTQGQRNQALQGFKTGAYRILVATDVAARGLHVDNIAHVVNYDLPMVPEDFIHRTGRTGRAGASGTASTFSTRQERGDLRKIERALSLRLTRRDLPQHLSQA